jgi:hypothetical protein
MKRSILMLCISAAFTSCTSSTPLPVLATEFISVDTANRMISSYLNSINYQSNDSSLHSLVIDAIELKRYLDTTRTGNTIKKLKIMFAHKLSYINSGQGNQFAGYDNDALTIVIAGVNENGDYVVFPGNKVFNNSMPCPTSCPEGTASSPLIQ